MGDNEQYTAMNLYAGVVVEVIRAGGDAVYAAELAGKVIDAFNKQFGIK
jgi:hypothetical protein